MKLDALKADFARCGIDPEIKWTSFAGYKSINKVQGLYSIWQGDRCIYVGKTRNDIRVRFKHHYNKAHGLFETGTTDTVGWGDGRVQEWWKPETWTVEYFACANAVHRTYLEGAMMLVFDPFCNDETFEERKKLTG